MSAIAPPRVGLLQACDDPQLFGIKLWPKQRELLEAVEAGPRIHCWSLGRRSGKTLLSALTGLWCCLLRPELQESLRPGERSWSVGIATNLRQARLLVRAAASVVERSPLLAPLIESISEDELLFANSTGFGAFACSSRGGRGWAIHCLLADELAHFLTETEGPQVADRVWQALLPSTATFGDQARIIAASTPWGDNLFAQLHAQARSGELEDARAAQETTAAMNPTISEKFLAAEQRRDPEGYRSEYLAEFVGSGGAFFDPDNIAAAVTLPGELRPDDARDWVCGLDPSFAGDPFGAVLVGRDLTDRRRLLVGAVRSWLPPRRKAASLEEGRMIEDGTLAEVATFIKLFGATAVTDQFKSSGVSERLRRFGIAVHVESMTATTKDASFGFLRGRLNEGSIEFPPHADLLRELRAVRTRHVSGRSSVVLPRVGKSHCDLAQSLSIAVLRHDSRGIGLEQRISVEGEGVYDRDALLGMAGSAPLRYDDAF